MGLVLDLLSGGAISGVLGGITGLLGTWIKGKHEEQMATTYQLDRAAERLHEIETLKLEAQSALAISNINRQESSDMSASKALAASYGMEPKRFSEGVRIPNNVLGEWFIAPVIAILMFALDFVRGATRPALTIYLAILMTIIFYMLKDLMVEYGAALTSDQVMTLVLYMVNVISYLFITIVLWWFGDRNRNAPPVLTK